MGSETLPRWELLAPEAIWERDLLETPNEASFRNENLAFAFALLQTTKRADYNMVSELSNKDSRPEWAEPAYNPELPHLDDHRKRR